MSTVTTIIMRRLERISALKRNAIAASNRDWLLQVEIEERLLQSLLDEIANDLHGVGRAFL